jgi:hypothetical protein
MLLYYKTQIFLGMTYKFLRGIETVLTNQKFYLARDCRLCHVFRYRKRGVSPHDTDINSIDSHFVISVYCVQNLYLSYFPL